MSYPDPFDDAREARQRARHGGAAPEPYAQPRYGAQDPPRWDDPQGWPATSTTDGDSSERIFVRPGSSADAAPDGGSAWPNGAGGDSRAGADGASHAGAGQEPEPPRRRGKGRRRANRSGARVSDLPTTDQPVGRAGRNLPAAIGVGLGLIIVVLASLYFRREAFLLVVVVAVVIAIWEMTKAIGTTGVHPPLVPLLAGALLMSGLAWVAGPDGLALGLLVTVLAVMVWRIGDGPRGFQRDVTAATLIAVYVPFLGGFAALLAVPDDGAFRVMVTLAAVVLTDTGGYAAGVFLGRHPMAPSVSPKKSWEGFGGSVFASAVGSALLLYFLLDVAPWWGALFGLAITAAAVLGDLAESMIKRDLGVKDMSSLLPGHGGLMDRLDSVLFAVPTAYLLLSLLAPSG